MLHHFRRALPVAAFCVIGTGVSAFDTDPRPKFGDILTVDHLATFIANTGIAALRTQMELEYRNLGTDIMRGTVSISGITARPQLPYDRAQQCEITIERAVLNSDISKPFEVASELTLDLIGAVASTACLPPEIATGARAAGFREIEIDSMKMAMSYDYSTGETSGHLSASAGGIATLDVAAAGTLLPRLGQFGRPGDPAVRVTRAVASLKDRGGWAAISAVLPPNFQDPATVREILTEQLTQGLSAGGTRALNAVERNFVTALMDRVEEYLRDPGEITVEADLPPTGIVVEPDTYGDPSELIAALALTARAAPLAQSQIVGAEILAALSDETASLGAEERLALAEALLTGAGVPRVPGEVQGLLTPLLSDGAYGGRAAALIARALQDRDPAAAYRHALVAAAADADEAVALLDRLEARLTTPKVLELQAAYASDNALPPPLAAIGDTTDPRDLRRLAIAHYAGDTAPRSYARAYYYALMAEAAGDIGAGALRSEIEARFGARGPEAETAWSRISSEVQTEVLADWIASDLPAQFRQN